MRIAKNLLVFSMFLFINIIYTFLFLAPLYFIQTSAAEFINIFYEIRDESTTNT